MSTPNILPFTEKEGGVVTQESAKPRRHPALSWQRLFCIFLHVFLVVIFLSIGITRATYRPYPGSDGTYHVKYKNWEQQEALDVSIVMGSQLVGTIYTALLLFTTQQLALRADLHRYQYLSLLHDRATAWSGLGNAFLCFVRQYKLVTSLGPLVAVASYLACMLAVHIAAPAVLSPEWDADAQTMRLEINLFPWGLGLAASIVLLGLCVYLTHEADCANKACQHSKVTGSGVLQVAWLVANHPESVAQLSRVATPTTDALRKGGKFRTRLSNCQAETTGTQVVLGNMAHGIHVVTSGPCVGIFIGPDPVAVLNSRDGSNPRCRTVESMDMAQQIFREELRAGRVYLQLGDQGEKS